MSLLRPPRVELSWTATALGTAFGAYRIYRRPARGVAAAWEQIGEITVPSGYTAATVEAQHTRFTDYEAGWAATGGQWADGWDYAVTVYNATYGVESTKTSVDVMNQVTGDANPWLTTNAAPYYNTPLEKVSQAKASDDNNVTVYLPAGRDFAVTRTRLELPARRYQLAWDSFDQTDEDPLRYPRAVAVSGRQVALLLPLGERVLGTLSEVGGDHRGGDLTLGASAKFVETARSSVLADHNQPAGLVLNGSSQYVTHADNTLLNPSSSAFSIVVAAAFANSAGSRYALAKGNLSGGADGYGLRSTANANELQFFVDGATTSGGPTDTSATWYDGNVHVAVGTTSGTAQALYRDGATTPVATTSVTHGAVTNAVALTAGANNAGASGFMACAPIVAYAVYFRALTATEARNASYYLLGYPGYRMPAGPVLFVDLRDTRCWNGYATSLTDLAGNTLTGTVTATPATRGIPWDLSKLDRFA